MRMTSSIIATALFLVPCAHAANWQTVAQDRDKRVDIDRARVGRLEGGKHVAWSRVAMSDAATEAASGRRYAIVEVLNHYDCAARTFAVVRRIYLGTDQAPVREERIADPQHAVVPAGTYDEKLFDRVCTPHKAGSDGAARASAAHASATSRQESAPGDRRTNPESTTLAVAGGAEKTGSAMLARSPETATKEGKRQISALALQIADAASLAAAQAQRDGSPATKRGDGR